MNIEELAFYLYMEQQEKKEREERESQDYKPPMTSPYKVLTASRENHKPLPLKDS